jgi:large subunit ribosomal protein L10
MPKSKQQKETTVATLVDGLKTSKGAVFANFQGLTVAAAEDLRRKCRAEGISMLVAKKTLIKRALGDIGLQLKLLSPREAENAFIVAFERLFA